MDCTNLLLWLIIGPMLIAAWAGGVVVVIISWNLFLTVWKNKN
jgi:hypothetical protein